MPLRSFRAARALTQFYGTAAAAAAALIDRMARRRTCYASPPTRRTRGIFTMFGLTKHFSELVGKMRNCSKSLFYRGASENSRARANRLKAQVWWRFRERHTPSPVVNFRWWNFRMMIPFNLALCTFKIGSKTKSRHGRRMNPLKLEPLLSMGRIYKYGQMINEI